MNEMCEEKIEMMSEKKRYLYILHRNIITDMILDIVKPGTCSCKKKQIKAANQPRLMIGINPFTTGNPFLGTKSLGFSIGRGLGARKGLKSNKTEGV